MKGVVYSRVTKTKSGAVPQFAFLRKLKSCPLLFFARQFSDLASRMGVRAVYGSGLENP